jgi:hypothetical protein
MEILLLMYYAKKNFTIILVILVTLLLIAIVIWIFNNRIISIENKIPMYTNAFDVRLIFLTLLKISL